MKMIKVKKIYVSILCVVLSLSMSDPLYCAIPEEERAALVALYNAANGDQWSQAMVKPLEDILISRKDLDDATRKRIEDEITKRKGKTYSRNNAGWKKGRLEADGFALRGSEGTWNGITVEKNRVVKIKLTRFDLIFNSSIPAALGNLGKLRSLELGTSNMTPEERFKLPSDPKDRAPSSQGNPAVDSIPPELGKLTGLEVLKIRNCSLSGKIQPELGNLRNLKTLDLSGNKLEGTLPVELTNLKRLETLILKRNRFNGSIPVELKKMNRLKSLDLSVNAFDGVISWELSGLNNLEDLNLGDNLLSSTIPNDFGKLGKLQFLNLSHNRLTGTIPRELGNLKKLQQLHLQGNRLRGEVPASLTGCPLYLIDLSYNGFYSTNSTVRAFLGRLQSSWFRTQTTTPEGVSAVSTSDSSVQVSWKPITFVEGNGHYKVFYGISGSGPWQYGGITSDKKATSFEVKGLEPGKKYWFMVNSQTDPDPNNKNEMISDVSAPVTTGTK